MYEQSFQLPTVFHVVAVQVATVWTNPKSVRAIDQLAVGDAADMEKWIMNQSKSELLALSLENLVQTQILYGEVAIVTEVKGDWAKVHIPSQTSRKDANGYPGWVPLSQLKEVRRENWYRPKTAAIINRHTWLKDEKGEKVIRLSYMTCLPLKNVRDSRVEVITPQGKGYLQKEAVEIFSTENGGKRGDGESLIKAGEQFIGLEYLWGGMSAFGYDCSGFTYTLHKANGYQISRDASDQAVDGKEIPFDELRHGDLLFFADDEGKGYIHHVGIFYGEGKMLHSPSTGRGIEIVALAGTNYERELCAQRRYWEAGDV